MKMMMCFAGAALLLGACASDEPAAPAPAVQKVKVKRVTAPPAVKKEDFPEPSRIVTPPAAQKPKRASISQVDLQQVFEMQQAGTILLVDVRPALFYTLGHIPGSIGMQKKTFDAAFPERQGEFDAAVAAGKTIVLYCANDDCPDGYAAAKILAKKGYSSAVYKGGYDEWKASGL